MEEKLFIINLRREFNKAQNYKRSKKAITALKEYISRHMKVSINNVKIGKNLNLKIWERGRKNPPAKVKVKSAINDNKAYVELPEFPLFEEVKIEGKKESKPIDIKAATVKEDKKVTEIKDEKKKEDLKALEKEEVHEQKKEHHHEHIETPQKAVKEEDKINEAKAKRGRVVGSTGKKQAKEAKP